MDQNSNSSELVVTITEGRTAVVGRLSSFELMQATSYAGEYPSRALIEQATSVCSVRKIDGVDVHPTKNRSEFEKVAKQLMGDDLLLIGMAAVAAMRLTDDQKKALKTLAEG